MTAQEEVLELVAARMRDMDLPIPTKRAQMLLVAYDTERRAELAEEFAAFAERHVTQAGHCAGCDMALVLAEELRRMAAPTTTQEQQ